MMFLKSGWTKSVRDFLLPALGDDELIISSQVDSGLSDLSYVYDDAGVFAGCCVLRTEGKELVIVVMVASRGKDIVDAIYEYARLSGYSSIRFHSCRKGMKRYAERHGYMEVEKVFRRVVSG